jgi:hypothetical protein
MGTVLPQKPGLGMNVALCAKEGAECHIHASQAGPPRKAYSWVVTALTSV